MSISTDLGYGARAWIGAARSIRIWSHLAYRDIRSVYASTRLGPGWSVVSVLLTGVILGFVYARLFNQDPVVFLPFLFSGFLAWGLLASFLGEATNAFRDSRRLLLNTHLDGPVVAFRYAWRATITFLLGIPVVVPINAVLGQRGFGLLYLPLALVVAFVFGIALLQIMGWVTAYVPTVRYLMPSIVQLLFLVTPVFWSPDQIPSLAWLARINPLASFLQLLRNALLGNFSALALWLEALIWTAIAAFLAVLATRSASMRYRIEI